MSKNGKKAPKNGGKSPMVGVEGAFSVLISISLHLRSHSISPSVLHFISHFHLHHHHSSFRRRTRARRGISALRKVWTIKHMFQTRNATQTIRALFEILRCFWGKNNPPFYGRAEWHIQLAAQHMPDCQHRRRVWDTLSGEWAHEPSAGKVRKLLSALYARSVIWCAFAATRGYGERPVSTSPSTGGSCQ